MNVARSLDHQVDDIRVELEARIALLEDDLKTTEDLLGVAELRAHSLMTLLAAAYRLVEMLRQSP